MKPQELLSPKQTFFSVVWTRSNMLRRKLTTTVSEWVTSVTVRQQLQCQQAAEWIQSLLLSLFVPLRCDPSLPSAAAVHCQCQCSGWDTSSGNDLPTYETWEENRSGGGGVGAWGSFKSLGFLLCQHSRNVCNQLGGEKKTSSPLKLIWLIFWELKEGTIAHLSSNTLKSETRSQTRSPLRAALDE